MGSERKSQTKDFIGLYKKGECNQTDYAVDVTNEFEGIEVAKEQNKCSIATIDLPKGQLDGEIRFPSQVIKEAGEYELRYFAGNSLDGQGYVCRYLPSAVNTDGHFKFCALEAIAHSDTIKVSASVDDSSHQHISEDASALAESQKIPGLETYCFGDECSDM